MLQPRVYRNLVRTFTIHPSGECRLQLGRPDRSGNGDGTDFLTGRPITAECYGTIASIQYAGEDYPTVVVVTPE